MGARVEREAGREPATVIFVADGDTLQVRREGKKEWVRLLRIDTPEKEERGYAEARNALLSLAQGREAFVVFERDGDEERDRHGRLLAYLFCDGRNVNVEMVRRGWSPFWTRYGEGRYAAAFRSAEEEARRGNAGLWAERP